jgi:hypothetical protein
MKFGGGASDFPFKAASFPWFFDDVFFGMAA